MTPTLRFKPWLAAIPLDISQALILSETTSHTLKGELLVAMLPLLDGSRTEDEIVDQMSERFDLPDIYYQLLQLHEKGLIEAVSQHQRSADEILHDRLQGDDAKLGETYHLVVTGLDGLDPLPVANRLSRLGFCETATADWRQSDVNGDAIWVVLTTDYLTPDLATFNTRALATGTRWLPYKPDGIEPWFGPFIVPGKTACLECLLHRMRGHWTRALQIAEEQGELLRFSQGRTDASLDASCGLLGLELEKALSGSPHSFIDKGVVSINLKSLKTQRHELVRRRHCPACGQTDDPILHGLPTTDFPLTSQPKADYHDGGDRIKSAAETMASFETRISPITGEVGTLDTREDIPEFFGPAVISTWATLNGCRAEASKGRNRPAGSSAGKGRSEVQARASALGEALERYCSQHFGYEPYRRASYAEIKDTALHPLALNPFTDSQYDNREEWAKRHETGRIPHRFDENAPVDWTPAWSLTHKCWKFVPSAFMYFHYPKEGGGDFAYGNSNGVAAGNCVEEAIIQGFMELVERDGIALWWYNMVRYPCLDLSTFGSGFAMEAAAGLRRNGYLLHVLNLTTDLGIPIFAAVGLHACDPEAEPHLGFGAHFDARIALNRAISEMGQSWSLVRHQSPNKLCRELTGKNLCDQGFLRPAEGAAPIPLNAFANHATDNFLTDIGKCVSLLDDLGIEMLVADLTRPELGLSVVRVICPGLVHFWPRFGAPRLYEVPVKLGLLDKPKREAELFQAPFYS